MRDDQIVRYCVELAAAEWSVEPADRLLGREQNARVARARHLAVWLIRHHTEANYMDVADFFGRSHPAVLHSARTIDRRTVDDPTYARYIRRLSAAVKRKGGRFRV